MALSAPGQEGPRKFRCGQEPPHCAHRPSNPPGDAHEDPLRGHLPVCTSHVTGESGSCMGRRAPCPPHRPPCFHPLPPHTQGQEGFPHPYRTPAEGPMTAGSSLACFPPPASELTLCFRQGPPWITTWSQLSWAPCLSC